MSESPIPYENTLDPQDLLRQQVEEHAEKYTGLHKNPFKDTAVAVATRILGTSTDDYPTLLREIDARERITPFGKKTVASSLDLFNTLRDTLTESKFSSAKRLIVNSAAEALMEIEAPKLAITSNRDNYEYRTALGFVLQEINDVF